ncbi:unnamed protein product [Jaminaea pallidilutea]
MAAPTSSPTGGIPTPSPSPTGLPIIDHPDVDNDCRLLGPFALVVQGLMGILVLGTLVWKRQRENPRRPWKIWLLDITKQMLGQLFVHTLNVLLSNFVADVGDQNPCSLYFLNILVDTTLGVFIIYLTLRVTTHVLTDVWGFTGFVSGQYSDRNKRGRGKASRPKLSYWLKQLGSYFFALFMMKLVVTLLFVIFPFLFAFGRWLLDLFGEAKNVQVLFVMCIFPLAMNTLQFWLVDSFLRHDPNKSKYSSRGDSGSSTPGDSEAPAWGAGPESSQHGANGEAGTGRRRFQDSSGRGDEDEGGAATHLVGEVSDEEEEDEGQSSDQEAAESQRDALVETGRAGDARRKGFVRTASHAYPPPESSSGSSRRGSPAANTHDQGRRLE